MANAPAIELTKRPKVGARIFVRITIVGDSHGGDDTIPLHELPVYRRRWGHFNRSAEVRILDDWHRVPMRDERGNIIEDDDGNVVYSNKLLHSRVKALTRQGMIEEIARQRGRHDHVEIGDNVFRDFWTECYTDERTFIKRNQRALERFRELSQNEQRMLTVEDWEELASILDPNRQQEAIQVIPEDVFDALNESHAENEGDEADASVPSDQAHNLDRLAQSIADRAKERLSKAGVKPETADPMAAAWASAEIAGEDLSAEELAGRGIKGLDTEAKAQALLDVLSARE